MRKLRYIMRCKFIFIAVLAAAAVRCEEAPSEVSGPYVPPQVRGYDGRRLVWEPGAEDPKQPYEPDFSPDGTKVVVSYRNGVFGRDADIAILDLATRELKVVLEGNSAKRPQWSPKGDWIVYQSDHPSHFGRTLWLVRPDGSENHMLDLRNKSGYLPYWSYDGSRIYYVGDYVPREPMYALWYDLEAEELGVLRKPVSEFHHNMAAPSPLGDKVALGLMAREGYVKHAVRNVVLAFINTDGSDFEVVWAEPADAAPEPGEPRDWSPDGKYVLLRFEPTLGTGNSLWTYEVKTGVVRQLTMCPPDREYDHVTYGSWGPNGDIVFGTDEGWLYLIKAPE
jgi:dipeptidyl aminopeptidase/acylaminoacyl peptidase